MIEGEIRKDSGQPIRVAQVIGKLNAAGVEAVINNYYRNLDHSRYQFDYYIDADSNFAPPEALKQMGARYYVVPPYQHIFKHMWSLIRHFKENRYQIVHANMNTLSVFSLCAAWLAGVPVRINHNHSTAGKGELKRNMLKYCLRPFAGIFATDYCACSLTAGKWLFGKGNVQKVKVIQNAVEISRYRFDPDARRELRRELGIEDQLVVGHVGRFCTTKNHTFILQVFRELVKQRPDAVLLLVGTGERVEEIRKQVISNGLDGKVFFMGARGDVERMYQAMDVFLFPSLYEGLGMAAIEAQISGLPALCSEEVPKEATVLPGSMRMSLRESPKRWAELIEEKAADTLDRNAAKDYFVGKQYDIRTEAVKLQDYYDELLAR